MAMMRVVRRALRESMLRDENVECGVEIMDVSGVDAGGDWTACEG